MRTLLPHSGLLEEAGLGFQRAEVLNGASRLESGGNPDPAGANLVVASGIQFQNLSHLPEGSFDVFVIDEDDVTWLQLAVFFG